MSWYKEVSELSEGKMKFQLDGNSGYSRSDAILALPQIEQLGGIGLFEVVTREVVVLFSFMMIDRTVASAYVTVVHIALLLPMIVGGQIFLITDQITFKKLLDNSKQG